MANEPNPCRCFCKTQIFDAINHEKCLYPAALQEIAELKETISRMNEFDVPQEMVNLRTKVAELERSLATTRNNLYALQEDYSFARREALDECANAAERRGYTVLASLIRGRLSRARREPSNG